MIIIITITTAAAIAAAATRNCSSPGIQVKRPQSSLAAFSEVSDSVRSDVIENLRNASKERRAAGPVAGHDKNLQSVASDLHGVSCTAS